MANAPVPRPPELARILQRFNARIRRLEVNRTQFKTGVAVYTIGSASATASWNSDWSAATKVQDSIGCSAAANGIILPPEWMFWAHVVFAVNTTSVPPTGETLQWAAFQDGTLSSGGDIGFGDYKYDPLIDSSDEDAATQVFGGTVIGATGNGTTGGVFLGQVSSLLGTEFIPFVAGIGITAAQLYTPAFPHGTEDF